MFLAFVVICVAIPLSVVGKAEHTPIDFIGNNLLPDGQLEENTYRSGKAYKTVLRLHHRVLKVIRRINFQYILSQMPRSTVQFLYHIITAEKTLCQICLMLAKSGHIFL